MNTSNDGEDKNLNSIDTLVGSGISLETFQTIFDQSPRAIVIFDLLGNFVHCNQAFFPLFGFPEPYSIRNFNLFEENHISKNVLQALMNGEKVRREYEFNYDQLKTFIDFKIPLNHKLIFEIDYIPIKDLDGKTKFFACILDDISKRRQTQEKIIQSIQLQTSGQFAAGIAHDFNNILTQIMGYLDLVDFDIQDLPQIPDSLKESISIIRNASHRAQELTSSLLSFSRQGKYNPKIIDINKIAVEAVTLISKGLKSPVRYEFKIQLTAFNQIFADETQMFQILQNLILNARDSMKNGGIIEIKTEDISTEGILGKLEPIPSGNYVKLVVKDNGCGIHEKNLSKLFQSFYSTKEKGSGLGLAVIFGILKNHRAFIDVETKIDEGSVFSLYFPIKNHNNEEKQSDLHHQKINNILVVDDEKTIRQIMQKYLEKLHFNVVTASDGIEALKIYKMMKIDLVITDLIMEPMDGYDLFHEIRRLNPNQAIWIMSGYYKDEKVQQLMESGALGFMNKPFSYQDIVNLTKGMTKEELSRLN